MKVVLIGLPGSGKSTFGKQLASAMKLEFLDLDNLIEARVGQSIPDIFSLRGEDEFRRVESEILKEVLEREEDLILASGGGAPCFFDNMDHINQFSTSVYLDLPLTSIASRLSHSKHGNRPMFRGMDKQQILDKLNELSEARRSFYNKSKIKLSGEDFSADLLIYELARELKS